MTLFREHTERLALSLEEGRKQFDETGMLTPAQFTWMETLIRNSFRVLNDQQTEIERLKSNLRIIEDLIT